MQLTIPILEIKLYIVHEIIKMTNYNLKFTMVPKIPKVVPRTWFTGSRIFLTLPKVHTQGVEGLNEGRRIM